MSRQILLHPEISNPRLVQSARAIRRKKLVGPGIHEGVMLETILGDRVVYDRTPRLGIQRSTVQEYLKGRTPQLGAPITDINALMAIVGRLRETLTTPVENQYDAIGKNCEHFSNYVLHGAKRSPQVAGLAVVGLVLAICLFGGA